MKRMFLSAAAAICAAVSAQAAQFQPSSGGNLDDAANWNTPSDTTYAITKRQSAALSISADNATLPNSAASLSYRSYTYTNNWTSGWTLSGTGYLEVQSGAGLVHESGTMKFSKATGSSVAGTLEITGAGSVVELGSTTVSGTIVVTNSAVFKPDMNVTVDSGGSLLVDGATLHHNVPDTGTSYAITVKGGGEFFAKNSTITLPTAKSALKPVGATAVIDGCTIDVGNQSVVLGGDGGTLLFTGSPSTINHRFTMSGDDFTFCVSNATVNFAPTTASDLFITGSGSAYENYARRLRFCGAAPRLAIASSGGLYLRGAKGITLQFDIGRDGYPSDQAVVEITGGGSFRGDTTALSTSQIVVNIDAHTAPGTYTLLKGKNAATFLTGENKWVTNSDRAVIFANGNDEVVVTVKAMGLAIIFR